jgi:hypothetical protein
MAPRAMRWYAVVFLFVSALMASLGMLNITSDYIGGGVFGTFVAFGGAACGVFVAGEAWYVGRRIERAQAVNHSSAASH